MCRICPKCGGIAEFSEYYGQKVVCTRCGWESEELKNSQEAVKYSYYPNQEYDENKLTKKKVYNV